MTKLSLTFIILGGLAILGCTSATPVHQSDHDMHMQMASDENRKLTIDDQSTDNEVIFYVREGDETFTKFGVSHTKEMHLMIVRDDLRNFAHIHPERDPSGAWKIPFKVPAAGRYWFFADFIDVDGISYTMKFTREYIGDRETYGLAKNFETVKTADGLTYTFAPAIVGNNAVFAYDIMDAKGNHPQLEEYLGANGHSVLISPTGDFIHSHASNGENPVFEIAKPKSNFYRIFTQFQVEGKVLTIDFDWQAP